MGHGCVIPVQSICNFLETEYEEKIQLGGVGTHCFPLEPFADNTPLDMRSLACFVRAENNVYNVDNRDTCNMENAFNHIVYCMCELGEKQYLNP